MLHIFRSIQDANEHFKGLPVGDPVRRTARIFVHADGQGWFVCKTSEQEDLLLAAGMRPLRRIADHRYWGGVVALR